MGTQRAMELIAHGSGEGTSCPNIQEGEHFPDIYEDQGCLSLHSLEVVD